MIAKGASQLARRDVGTPVFGGMIAASFLGIFVIPPPYVVFRAVRERLRPSTRPREIGQPAGSTERAEAQPGAADTPAEPAE